MSFVAMNRLASLAAAGATVALVGAALTRRLSR